MNTPLKTLSEMELNWLDDFLLNRFDDEVDVGDRDEGIFLISTLDGFFTAIISGPEMIPPSTWLQSIWGDFEPEWKNSQQAEQVISLLIRFMNGNADFLLHDPHNFEPMFMEREVKGKTYMIVDDWCEGYMRGVELQLNQWQLESSDMQLYLAPIKAFTVDYGMPMDHGLTQQEIEERQQAITSNVIQIYEFWLDRRSENPPDEMNQTSLRSEVFFKDYSIPVFNADELKQLSEKELVQLMVKHEDRVPRNVIDASVNRGDAILQYLAAFQDQHQSPLEIDGHWWMIHHAIMILGLMDSQASGELMLEFIDYLVLNKEDDLQDWLAAYWSALTRNKSTSFIEKLLERVENKHLGWYMRANLATAVVAHAEHNEKDKLEQKLDWLATIAGDETEDWDFRLSAGSTLLDMPRKRHRNLLDRLASQQEGLGAHFDEKDVSWAFAENNKNPEWIRFKNPWQFYDTDVIQKRQKRWMEEDQRSSKQNMEPAEDPMPWLNQPAVETFVRDTPKVGRNDPCPCGSGKKYKKCCLH